LNRLPEIRRFINEEANNYPDLSVNYFGGDPRIKFVTSEDGSALNINAYQHYTDSTRGVETDKIINISSLNFDSVKALLKERGVRRSDEAPPAVTHAAPAAPATPATPATPGAAAATTEGSAKAKEL